MSRMRPSSRRRNAAERCRDRGLRGAFARSLNTSVTKKSSGSSSKPWMRRPPATRIIVDQDRRIVGQCRHGASVRMFVIAQVETFGAGESG